MAFVEGVRIQTADFTMRADRISGRQIWAALERLTALTAGGGAAASEARCNPVGPGAIRSPAEQFSTNGVSPALTDPSAPSNGFAPGGADSLRQLDPRAMLDLILRFVQNLVQALVQMLRADSSGQGAGQCGSEAGAGAGAAGGASSLPGMGAPGIPGGSSFSPTPTKPRIPSPRLPDDAAARLSSDDSGRGRSCAQDDRPGAARRILARIGAGALGAATGAAAGGAPGAALGAASSIRSPAQCDTQGPPRNPNVTPQRSGGSLEDLIASFFQNQLRDIERELKTAMEEADQAGQGDSRSAAANKVQQLVNRRSEMIEMITNSLKTLHESSMAVNRNIK